jgi:hypothetical protein
VNKLEITPPSNSYHLRYGTVADAIEAAKNHPVNFYIGAGDYAWLTDQTDKVIWAIKLEEVPC